MVLSHQLDLMAKASSLESQHELRLGKRGQDPTLESANYLAGLWHLKRVQIIKSDKFKTYRIIIILFYFGI